jgi:hypothetical protein
LRRGLFLNIKRYAQFSSQHPDSYRELYFSKDTAYDSRGSRSGTAGKGFSLYTPFKGSLLKGAFIFQFDKVDIGSLGKVGMVPYGRSPLMDLFFGCIESPIEEHYCMGGTGYLNRVYNEFPACRFKFNPQHGSCGYL